MISQLANGGEDLTIDTLQHTYKHGVRTHYLAQQSASCGAVVVSFQWRWPLPSEPRSAGCPHPTPRSGAPTSASGWRRPAHLWQEVWTTTGSCCKRRRKCLHDALAEQAFQHAVRDHITLSILKLIKSILANGKKRKLFNHCPLQYSQYMGQRARFLKFLMDSWMVQERFPSTEVRVCFTALTFSPGPCNSPFPLMSTTSYLRLATCRGKHVILTSILAPQNAPVIL